MKRILFIFIAAFTVLSNPHFLYAEAETDPGLRLPIEVAKEYVAKKYNCDINDLTVSDALIGRGGADIDVNHGYETEKVVLVRKDFGDDWEVESSEPAHQY